MGEWRPPCLHIDKAIIKIPILVFTVYAFCTIRERFQLTSREVIPMSDGALCNWILYKNLFHIGDHSNPKICTFWYNNSMVSAIRIVPDVQKKRYTITALYKKYIFCKLSIMCTDKKGIHASYAYSLLLTNVISVMRGSLHTRRRANNDNWPSSKRNCVSLKLFRSDCAITQMCGGGVN